MDIRKTLNEEMLGQDFVPNADSGTVFDAYSRFAAAYAAMEQGIAVLSDVKANRSRLFYGGIAARFGLTGNGEIDTIWEEEIYKLIHPDDLTARHLLELRFFLLLKKLSSDRCRDYHTESRIRMRDRSGQYVVMRHRTFFVHTSATEELDLSLCLYDFAGELQSGDAFEGRIVDSARGEIIRSDATEWSGVLTAREREVLTLIKAGMRSKEIACHLSVSLHTVNRHRQNLLAKLRVGSAIEALKVAGAMGLV